MTTNTNDDLFADLLKSLTDLRSKQIAIEAGISSVYREAKRSKINVGLLKEKSKEIYVALKAKDDNVVAPARIAEEKERIPPIELVEAYREDAELEELLGPLTADAEIDHLIAK
jgi:hypothetical protein